MKHLNIIFLMLFCLPGTVFAAKCEMPGIETCPNLYVERCHTDKKFLAAHSADCFRAISPGQSDSPECQAFDPANCAQNDCIEKAKKEGISVDIQGFLAECGMPKCPQQLKDIQKEYKNIANRLKAEFVKYDDILKLNPKNIIEPSALCKYTPEQLANYEKLANADRATLNKATGRLTFLRKCSKYVINFIENARRDGWNAELRDSIIRKAVKDSDNARKEGNKAEREIQNLKEAPQRIKDLREIYDLAC